MCGEVGKERDWQTDWLTDWLGLILNSSNSISSTRPTRMTTTMKNVISINHEGFIIISTAKHHHQSRQTSSSTNPYIYSRSNRSASSNVPVRADRLGMSNLLLSWRLHLFSKVPLANIYIFDNNNIILQQQQKKMKMINQIYCLALSPSLELPRFPVLTRMGLLRPHCLLYGHLIPDSSH